MTGTKAPGDIISVTYVDASGRRRTQHNVYIPWSMTVTPISQSDVGSVEASSLFRVSRLNCSITTSDGAVLVVEQQRRTADELLMVSRYSAYRRGSDAIPPDVIDRILLGACAAIWLVLLGVSVAAAVALADLGRGFHKIGEQPAHHVGAVCRHHHFGADHRRRDPGAVAGPPHDARPSRRPAGGDAGAGDRQTPIAARFPHTAHRGRAGPRA